MNYGLKQLMGQTSFLDTSSIRYLVPSLGFKRYFPIPNKPCIKQCMTKSKQALSNYIKTPAFDGRRMYIFKTFNNTREFNGYIYLTQNGFSSPLSWRALAYKMKCGRR